MNEVKNQLDIETDAIRGITLLVDSYATEPGFAVGEEGVLSDREGVLDVHLPDQLLDNVVLGIGKTVSMAGDVTLVQRDILVHHEDSNYFWFRTDTRNDNPSEFLWTNDKDGSPADVPFAERETEVGSGIVTRLMEHIPEVQNTLRFLDYHEKLNIALSEIDWTDIKSWERFTDKVDHIFSHEGFKGRKLEASAGNDFIESTLHLMHAISMWDVGPHMFGYELLPVANETYKEKGSTLDMRTYTLAHFAEMKREEGVSESDIQSLVDKYYDDDFLDDFLDEQQSPELIKRTITSLQELADVERAKFDF